MRDARRVDCDGCGAALEEPGGLLFAPPDTERRAQKFHLCVPCWASVPSLLGRLTDETPPERMMAEAFTRLSDDDQAQFFIEVAAIAEQWPVGNMDQWYAVGRHLRTCECSTEEARDLVRSIAGGCGDEG